VSKIVRIGYLLQNFKNAIVQRRGQMELSPQVKDHAGARYGGAE
jgi:hypothetical protein